MDTYRLELTHLALRHLQHGDQSHLRGMTPLLKCGHLAPFVRFIHDTCAALVDGTQGLQETCSFLEKHTEVRQDILLEDIPPQLFTSCEDNPFPALSVVSELIPAA